MTSVKRSSAPIIPVSTSANKPAVAAPIQQASSAQSPRDVSSFTAAKPSSSAASPAMARSNDDDVNDLLDNVFSKEDGVFSTTQKKNKDAAVYAPSFAGIEMYKGMADSMVQKKMSEYIKQNPDASPAEVKKKLFGEMMTTGFLVKSMEEAFKKLTAKNIWKDE